MRIAPLVAALLLAPPALAGTNANIISGVVSYQQQDYDLAIDKLENGLENPAIIKPRNVPKGWYYLGSAYIHQWSKAGQTPAGRDKLPDNLSLAATAFGLARASDTDGRWAGRIDAEQGPLSNALLQVASVEIVDAAALQASAKDELLHSALVHADHAIAIAPTNHLAYDLRGQALQGQLRNNEALDSFLKALDVFEQHPPSSPDLLVGLISVRASLLQRHPTLGVAGRSAQGDLNAALGSLSRGLAHTRAEWSRVANKPAAQQNYDYVVSTINTHRLDLLLNMPSQRDQAIKEFEAALLDEPTNYTKWIALAQLVQATNPERAEQVLLRAIELRPTEQVGRYNLAALYINQSAAVNGRANEEPDSSKAHALQTQAVALQRKARPHLEAALASEPNDPSVLRALVQVCLYTEDLTAYAIYKKQLDALK